jgi:glycosyltransferase involved in cell wall biosynthesis
MLIHFIHQGDAYLPELQAYAAFIEAKGQQFQLHRHVDSVPADATVLWWLCGQVRPEQAQRHPKAFHIHEYASASVPPAAWLKDQFKRWRQATPQYRIFQNAWVQQRMGFHDAVPSEFRDMGISLPFFEARPASATPEFDFAYLGEMRRLRHFLPVFDALAQAQHSVLLIGQLPEDLLPVLQSHVRLKVTGRIPHDQVPAMLWRARRGLNLVPDQLPYTRQTSTKLLEYCAAGLPVVSTDYPWVRDFEQRHGARLAYIPFSASAAAYLSHFTRIGQAPAALPPDLHPLAWPTLLAGMPIWRRLGVCT